MELWGFENNHLLDLAPAGLLDVAGRSSGPGGAGRTEAIPRSDNLPEPTEAEVERAKEGGSLVYQVVFPNRGTQHGHPNGLAANDPREYRYNGVIGGNLQDFLNTHNLTRDEVDRLRDQTTGLAYWNSGGLNGRGLQQFADSAMVYIYTPDTNNDGHPEKTPIALTSILDYSDHGIPGIGGTEEESPLGPLSDLRNKLGELRKQQKKIKALLAQLEAAGVNSIEEAIAMLRVINIKAHKRGTETAAIVTDAVARHERASERTHERLVGIIRGDQTDGNARANAEQSKHELENNTAMTKTLLQILEDEMSRLTEMERETQQIAERNERLNLAGSRGG